MDQTISLAKRLIACKSEKADGKALLEALQIAIDELNGFTIERFESNGSSSILVYVGKKRPEKFKVILNGHLDVMPGRPEQYQPTVKGDRLYGVGAVDMKSSVACLIDVFKENAQKVDYPLGLQLVTDEQVGGMDGTKHQIDQGVRADFVIAGESTGLNIAHESKGILWAKATFKGSPAHSAYPWKAKNPIWDLYAFMQALEKNYPPPAEQKWITTIAVSNIETDSTTFNKTPGSCTAWLDIRYTPNDDLAIVQSVKKLLPKNSELNILIKEPAMYTAADDPYILALQNASKKITGRQAALYGAQGSSDARHFARVGTKGVEFGPVGEGSGSDHEWVSIRSLKDYKQILNHFLSNL